MRVGLNIYNRLLKGKTELLAPALPALMSTCSKNELAAYNGHNLASDPYWSRPTDYIHKPSPQARINARNNQWEGRDLSSRVGVVYATKRGRFQRVKGSIPEGCNRAWCSRNIHLHARTRTHTHTQTSLKIG